MDTVQFMEENKRLADVFADNHTHKDTDRIERFLAVRNEELNFDYTGYVHA